MTSQTLFIVKLLVASTILAVAIKFTPVSIPATTTNALIGVLSPTLIMAIALLSRYANSHNRKIS